MGSFSTRFQGNIANAFKSLINRIPIIYYHGCRSELTFIRITIFRSGEEANRVSAIRLTIFRSGEEANRVSAIRMGINRLVTKSAVAINLSERMLIISGIEGRQFVSRKYEL